MSINQSTVISALITAFATALIALFTAQNYVSHEVRRSKESLVQFYNEKIEQINTDNKQLRILLV
ncbi:MAG: hypothetical protein AAFR66_20055, partial [Bacteroidota bacterium]